MTTVPVPPLLAGARGWSVGVNCGAERLAAEGTVADVIAAGGKAVALRGDVAAEAEVPPHRPVPCRRALP